MIVEIPATFRANAKITAERRLAGITDSDKARRIINQIAEEEWALDRLEWRNWMNQMRSKFNHLYSTPQSRVTYENSKR